MVLTIQQQWEKLLSYNFLPPDAPEIQKLEMKNAFFAGAVSILMQLKHEVSKLSESEGIKQLEDWFDEYNKHLKERLRIYNDN